MCISCVQQYHRHDLTRRLTLVLLPALVQVCDLKFVATFSDQELLTMLVGAFWEGRLEVGHFLRLALNPLHPWQRRWLTLMMMVINVYLTHVGHKHMVLNHHPHSHVVTHMTAQSRPRTHNDGPDHLGVRWLNGPGSNMDCIPSLWP